MTSFKKVGLTAAVAAATASYVGLSNAQSVSTDDLGDAAIIPYYTVQDGYRTGVHIINTTTNTQVVKFRMRRGSDSADALDFNIIMSPRDEWVASIALDGDDIKVITSDTTCTAPAGDVENANAVSFTMPSTFREGAEEGYIEVIGMGQPTSEVLSPLAVGAEHDDGVPADCATVRQNFFRVANADVLNAKVRGTHTFFATAAGNPKTTVTPLDQPPFNVPCPTGAGNADPANPNCRITTYDATNDRAFKVSYFVRDSAGGLEFGNNAIHLEGFSDTPRMTNQQALLIQDGVLIWDPLNFELPNLDGGPYDRASNPATNNWTPGGSFGKFPILRQSDVLGRNNVLNDWSARSTADFSVSTDWVVTLPGQYLMNNWAALAFNGGKECIELFGTTGPTAGSEFCVRTDLPVRLGISFWDREEASFLEEEGDLSVSPGGAPGTTQVLENEVNVIEWSKGQPNVLGSQYAKTFTPGVDADNGWALLGVSSNPFARPGQTPAVFYPDPNSPVDVAGTPVPIVGFAVWERNFGANAAANYGRAIDHSYGSSGILPTGGL